MDRHDANKTLMFLFDLAYKSCIALPILVLCGFLAFDTFVGVDLTISAEYMNPNNTQNDADEDDENPPDDDQLLVIDLPGHGLNELHYQLVFDLQIQVRHFRELLHGFQDQEAN